MLFSRHILPCLSLLLTAGILHAAPVPARQIASGGYTAAFSLAELSPDLGQRPAWLALSEDGQPLPAESGPANLIVPGDAKPGRWVHGVAAIVVRDEAAVPDGK